MPEDDDIPCEWVKDNCGYYCRTHDAGCSIPYGEHDAKLEKHECDRSGDYLRATMKSIKEKAYEEGQQNPDPKQYAKREELVEVYEKKLQTIKTGSQVGVAIYNSYKKFIEIIRTHGLEE